ncbi:unnamed protein product [Prorocentrum cordatum]|uniref:RRM domain-containing protein n=1 Tax=Prorocentrum cordatum TaxID=2364126 RepID=A0ABN9V796_9DINO|nr:unnamed protein product [Polarella glacialis]
MPSVPGGATHKGICFVSFADPQSVQACLAHQPHEVNGCHVVVDVAAPRGAPQQQRGMMPMQQAPQLQYAQQPARQAQYVQQPVPQVRYVQQPAHHFKGGQAPQPRGGAYAGGAPQQVMVQQPMGQGVPAAGAVVPGRLFLTRVPLDVTTADLQAYFEQYGQLQDVFIPNGGKGIAFVSFADHNKAMEVLQTRQHIVKEGQSEPLNVEQARDRPSQPAFGKGGSGAPKGPQQYRPF